MSEPVLSYFLHRMPDAWRWRVVDEVGEVVASGAAEDQASADAEAMAALHGVRITHRGPARRNP